MRKPLATIPIRAPGTLVPVLLLAATPAWPATVLLPEGTVIYAELDEKVTSSNRIGYQPDAHIWRDVTVGGVTVIDAGTPVLVEVSSTSERGIGGQGSSIEISAISVTVGDQVIPLLGGYGQQATNGSTASTAMSTAGSISGLPIGGFGNVMPGRKAKLEKGLIFNTRLPSDTYVEIPDDVLPTLNLNPPAGLTVSVVHQEITAISTDLPLSIRLCGQEWSNDVVVDKVNDKSVSPIPAAVISATAEGDCHSARVTVELNALRLHFKSGINRFSVAVSGVTDEVVLNVEI